MKILVKFKGLFLNSAGIDHDIFDVQESATIENLIDTLSNKYTKLPFKDKKTYFMVNENMADRDQVLKDGDQVIIFQMMAGG